MTEALRYAQLIDQAESWLAYKNPATADQARKDYNKYLEDLSALGFAISPRKNTNPLQ
jgi:hypothetical protein